MNGTAKNTISYTGVVTLSQYTDKKKFLVAQIHNAGKDPLFNFLADCLVGDFNTAKYDRPYKIMFLKVDTTTDEDSGQLEIKKIEKDRNAAFIVPTTAPEKVPTVSAGTVRYSFLVSQDILAGIDFNAIGLYSMSATEDDFENPSAVCLAEISKSGISASSVLVVDWELTFANN